MDFDDYHNDDVDGDTDFDVDFDDWATWERAALKLKASVAHVGGAVCEALVKTRPGNICPKSWISETYSKILDFCQSTPQHVCEQLHEALSVTKYPN